MSTGHLQKIQKFIYLSFKGDKETMTKQCTAGRFNSSSFTKAN